MVSTGDYVAIFQSIHRVMKAEKLLKRAKIEILLIPAPRQLTSDCGLAIRYAETVRREVLDLLLAEDLAPVEIYKKRADGFERITPEG
ncbi:MAG: DUF3343 domain-containing protein [Desulfuromonadales bacterium]|nr:DUF3343 domain-containing protein [Desulfuromonadales bacterium]